MRILVFAAAYFPPEIGGAQQLAYSLTRHLQLEGHVVKVLADEQPGSIDFDAVQPFSTSRALYVLADSANVLDKLRHKWDALAAVRREIDEFKPDIILCSHWDPGSYISWLAQIVGPYCPFVVIAHGTELKNLSARGLSLIVKKFLRAVAFNNASGVVADSHFTRETLQGLSVREDKIVVITPGIDHEYFADAPRTQREVGRAPRLITVCRLVPRKGVDTVIKALPQLLEWYPELGYRIVGDGPEKEYLVRFANELGVEKHVVFEGQVTESRKRELYAGADLFLMPSRQTIFDYEGFGIVFLEALAHGVPVIGTATGGIPDAVAHEATGLLVPPDDPPALATAAHRLLSNAALRQKFVNEADRRLRADSDWRVIARQYSAYLTKCVEKKDKRNA